LLLGNHFLQNGWQIGMPRNLVSMQDVLAAIDYICQLLGSADYVALGSDFDGGFGLDRVPQGLDTIADLQLIGEALKDYGYSDNDVAAILGLNWYHLLQDSLPRE
jgi:membrane dipeptidase